MNLNKIYLGDNIEILKTFPDSSIDCCVTSPPYYGLRDYGTGVWVGGDPNCPHYVTRKHDSTTTGHKSMAESAGALGAVGCEIYKSVCPKCGAIREDKQIGLEETPEEYIKRLVDVFDEVKRTLKPGGTLWVNIGDTYNGYKGNAVSEYNDSDYVGGHGFHPNRESGHGLECKNLKPKDLIGIPWMLAFALRDAGWYLRQDIIWSKGCPMPESVKDRCTKSHEYIFLLAKSQRYYFDNVAIQEVAENPSRRDDVKKNEYNGKRNFTDAMMNGSFSFHNGMRNKRDVWMVNPSHFKGAHFATFPEELIRPMILAGCPKGGIVLDPFMGSGTTGVVAKNNCRNYIGCELNQEYVKIAEERLGNTIKRLF